jgi:hypothetical protein
MDPLVDPVGPTIIRPSSRCSSPRWKAECITRSSSTYKAYDTVHRPRLFEILGLESARIS